MKTAALERVIQRAATPARPVDRCDLCSEALPPEHRHLLDIDHGAALCSCQACTVLFNRPVASNGHYRLIPRARSRLSAIDTAPLGVPVGLAYFVPRDDGSVLAHYPSPVGATEWTVDDVAWRSVVAAHPSLGALQPEVQALLVNTAWGACEHWIVPVDDCFRLVAIVRREWRGLSGGSTVWPEITSFFGDLVEREE